MMLGVVRYTDSHGVVSRSSMSVWVSLLGIPVTIRLGRKRLPSTNTQAYYRMFCCIGLWVVMNDVEDI